MSDRSTARLFPVLLLAGCVPNSEDIGATITASEAATTDAATDAAVDAETDPAPTETGGVEVSTSTDLLREFPGACYVHLAVDAAGALYLTGEASVVASPTVAPTMAARKLDPSGADLVVLVDDLGPAGAWGRGAAIAPLPEGGFVVAGRRDLGEEVTPLLQARDAAGALLWHEGDAIVELRETEELTFVAREAGLTRVAGAGGEIEWHLNDGGIFGWLGSLGERIDQFAPMPDFDEATIGAGVVRRRDHTGASVWSDTLAAGAVLHDLATTPAGDLVVVGDYYVGEPVPNTTAFIRRYGPGGALLWENTVEEGLASTTSFDDAYRSVLVLPDGRVAAAGIAHSEEGLAVVRVYAGDGALLAVDHFDHPGRMYEWYADMALTPTGEVVLIGCAGIDGWLRRVLL